MHTVLDGCGHGDVLRQPCAIQSWIVAGRARRLREIALLPDSLSPPWGGIFESWHIELSPFNFLYGQAKGKGEETWGKGQLDQARPRACGKRAGRVRRVGAVLLR